MHSESSPIFSIHGSRALTDYLGLNWKLLRRVLFGRRKPHIAVLVLTKILELTIYDHLKWLVENGGSFQSELTVVNSGKSQFTLHEESLTRDVFPDARRGIGRAVPTEELSSHLLEQAGLLVCRGENGGGGLQKQWQFEIAASYCHYGRVLGEIPKHENRAIHAGNEPVRCSAQQWHTSSCIFPLLRK